MRKFVGFMLMPVFSLALALEAPVEELGAGQPVPGFSSVAPGRPAAVAAQPPANQALTDLHFELQSMREEVRELRGIIEEQGNELQQLRQRQLDDYQDLDSRISGGGSAASNGQTPAMSQMPTMSQPSSQPSMATEPDSSEFDTPIDSGQPMDNGSFSPVAAGGPTGGDTGDYDAYISTYNLLKAKKIDEAVAGFKVFVAKFPNSQYTANAYYWLGEIYLLQNNLPESASAFANVAQKFPAHRKAEDSKFKLAKVYHLQGQNDKAKKLLAEVASSNSSAASLARAYLDENF